MISIVAAVANNGVIGAKNDLPWHLPEDMKHFKRITTGHAVLMGRKTYESIIKRIGKPLPNRTNIVITRQADYKVPTEVEVYDWIDKAIAAHPNEDIFVMGGAEIYKEMIGRADILYITHVDKDVEGDAYFPEIDPKVWKLTSEEKHDGFRFAEYTKTA